ncbi:MAG: twin-arginine translocase subunit TatC [Acidobacteria bacterium]|nr:MAG: twin-arginine translocase subunit TatC [Acidobacteriota bacterium]
MTAALSSVRRPEDDDAEGAGGAMSFLEHLDDLRKRIIYACVGIAAGMAIAFVFMERIVVFVLEPAQRVLPPGTELIFSRPTEGIAVYVDIAFMAGLVLAAPVIMYQVWLFVAPALYANEKKFVIPFVTLTAIGSAGGSAFNHYVLFPSMMSFFVTFTFAGIRFEPRVEYVFELYVRSMVGMVLVFQIPTLAFFLAKIRVVTARFLWRNLRYAILSIFIVAAVLTPSNDPWNMTIFATPMLALYLVGIVVAWLAEPRRSNDAGLRLVFAAAVLDQAWKRRTLQRLRL